MEKLSRIGPPDVMILDIEMPHMNGIQYLEKIMHESPLPVIICSSVAHKGSENAIRALSLGAIEVVEKPKLGVRDFLDETAAMFIDLIKAASLSQHKDPITPAVTTSIPKSSTNIDVIALGLSTGGVTCLETIIRSLKPPMPPIVVVQHMPKGFTKSFANRLDSLSPLTVHEAEEKMPLTPSNVYIAPGDLHLTVQKDSTGVLKTHLLDGPPISGHKPAVDVLFRSLVKIVPEKTAAFLLTGMGRDGAEGMLELSQHGAYTAAQDEATSVVYGMPKAAKENGGAKEILALPDVIIKMQSMSR